MYVCATCGTTTVIYQSAPVYTRQIVNTSHQQRCIMGHNNTRYPSSKADKKSRQGGRVEQGRAAWQQQHGSRAAKKRASVWNARRSRPPPPPLKKVTPPDHNHNLIISYSYHNHIIIISYYKATDRTDSSIIVQSLRSARRIIVRGWSPRSLIAWRCSTVPMY